MGFLSNKIWVRIFLGHPVHNGVILHAHPVRGESHNQRNATGEFATVPRYHQFDFFQADIVVSGTFKLLMSGRLT